MNEVVSAKQPRGRQLKLTLEGGKGIFGTLFSTHMYPSFVTFNKIQNIPFTPFSAGLYNQVYKYFMYQKCTISSFIALLLKIQTIFLIHTSIAKLNIIQKANFINSQTELVLCLYRNVQCFFFYYMALINNEISSWMDNSDFPGFQLSGKYRKVFVV